MAKQTLKVIKRVRKVTEISPKIGKHLPDLGLQESESYKRVTLWLNSIDQNAWQTKLH